MSAGLNINIFFDLVHLTNSNSVTNDLYDTDTSVVTPLSDVPWMDAEYEVWYHNLHTLLIHSILYNPDFNVSRFCVSS